MSSSSSSSAVVGGVSSPHATATMKRSVSLQDASNPNKRLLTLDDVVQGISRLDAAEPEQAPAPSERKLHTIRSRFSKMKSFMGMSQSSITCTNDNITAQDFQRIFDEWQRISQENHCPLPNIPKISAEFQKRMKQAKTKEVKAKLSFKDCGLKDDHVNTLTLALADTPKISQLDFHGNDGITDKAKKYIDRLIYCQLEASRKLSDDKALTSATFLSDVRWPDPSKSAAPSLSRSTSISSPNLGSQSVDTVHSQPDESTQVLAQVKVELDHANAKALIKATYQKYGEPKPITEAFVKKMWKKIVHGSMQTKHVQTLQHEDDSVTYLSMEHCLVQGLVETKQLVELQPVTTESLEEVQHCLETEIEHMIEEEEIAKMEEEAVEYPDVEVVPHDEPVRDAAPTVPTATQEGHEVSVTPQPASSNVIESLPTFESNGVLEIKEQRPPEIQADATVTETGQTEEHLESIEMAFDSIPKEIEYSFQSTSWSEPLHQEEVEAFSPRQDSFGFAEDPFAEHVFEQQHTSGNPSQSEDGLKLTEEVNGAVLDQVSSEFDDVTPAMQDNRQAGDAHETVQQLVHDVVDDVIDGITHQIEEIEIVEDALSQLDTFGRSGSSEMLFAEEGEGEYASPEALDETPGPEQSDVATAMDGREENVDEMEAEEDSASVFEPIEGVDSRSVDPRDTEDNHRVALMLLDPEEDEEIAAIHEQGDVDTVLEKGKVNDAVLTEDNVVTPTAAAEQTVDVTAVDEAKSSPITVNAEEDSNNKKLKPKRYDFSKSISKALAKVDSSKSVLTVTDDEPIPASTTAEDHTTTQSTEQQVEDTSPMSASSSSAKIKPKRYDFSKSINKALAKVESTSPIPSAEETPITEDGGATVETLASSTTPINLGVNTDPVSDVSKSSTPATSPKSILVVRMNTDATTSLANDSNNNGGNNTNNKSMKMSSKSALKLKVSFHNLKGELENEEGEDGEQTEKLSPVSPSVRINTTSTTPTIPRINSLGDDELRRTGSYPMMSRMKEFDMDEDNMVIDLNESDDEFGDIPLVRSASSYSSQLHSSSSAVFDQQYPFLELKGRLPSFMGDGTEYAERTIEVDLNESESSSDAEQEPVQHTFVPFSGSQISFKLDNQIDDDDNEVDEETDERNQVSDSPAVDTFPVVETDPQCDSTSVALPYQEHIEAPPSVELSPKNSGGLYAQHLQPHEHTPEIAAHKTLSKDSTHIEPPAVAAWTPKPAHSTIPVSSRSVNESATRTLDAEGSLRIKTPTSYLFSGNNPLANIRRHPGSADMESAGGNTRVAASNGVSEKRTSPVFHSKLNSIFATAEEFGVDSKALDLCDESPDRDGVDDDADENADTDDVDLKRAVVVGEKGDGDDSFEMIDIYEEKGYEEETDFASYNPTTTPHQGGETAHPLEVEEDPAKQLLGEGEEDHEIYAKLVEEVQSVISHSTASLISSHSGAHRLPSTSAHLFHNHVHFQHSSTLRNSSAPDGSSLQQRIQWLHNFLHDYQKYVGFPSTVNLSHGDKTAMELKFQDYIQSSQYGQVKVLLLHHNKFTHVEKLYLVRRFPSLVELDLSHNQIAASISKQAFPSTLLSLNLSHNDLKQVKAIQYLTNLKELNLSGNKIKEIDVMPSSLERLDVSHNWIEESRAFNALANHPSLKWLNATCNLIPEGYVSTIEKEVMKLIPTLTCPPFQVSKLATTWTQRDLVKPTKPKLVYDTQAIDAVVHRLTSLSPVKMKQKRAKMQPLVDESPTRFRHNADSHDPNTSFASSSRPATPTFTRSSPPSKHSTTHDSSRPSTPLATSRPTTPKNSRPTTPTNTGRWKTSPSSSSHASESTLGTHHRSKSPSSTRSNSTNNSRNASRSNSRSSSRTRGGTRSLHNQPFRNAKDSRSIIAMYAEEKIVNLEETFSTEGKFVPTGTFRK